MLNITNFIFEKLKINSKSKVNQYHYHPTELNELKELIKQLIEERGHDADLNDIDISKMKTLSNLFSSGPEKFFNGDISKWNVSNVEDMEELFENCKFNGDISEWDVSNVTDMQEMFNNAKFNGDISKWKVNKITNTAWMFDDCPLEKNPPKWYKA